jgi:hypothetical protein
MNRSLLTCLNEPQVDSQSDYVEDQLAFDAPSPWRPPDQFEIDDALLAVEQLGGRAVRVYTLSVRRPSDSPDLPRHVLGPGVFDEDAFRALDLVLARANALGIRIVIPFVDNWKWWGGKGEYAGFRGKEPKDFWTDPEIIGDFKRTVEYVITRKNTVTGTLYRDDKAILARETRNELECPHSWTRAGGDIYKAYHWPGFLSGQGYDEINLLALMQTKAHDIQGIRSPQPSPPTAPELLPICSPFGDLVERSLGRDGISDGTRRVGQRSVDGSRGYRRRRGSVSATVHRCLRFSGR